MLDTVLPELCKRRIDIRARIAGARQMGNGGYVKGVFYVGSYAYGIAYIVAACAVGDAYKIGFQRGKGRHIIVYGLQGNGILRREYLD